LLKVIDWASDIRAAIAAFAPVLLSRFHQVKRRAGQGRHRS
jgi:hypothetical protein